MTLPGVLRDLFRKSGRPIERVVDLVPGRCSAARVRRPFGARPPVRQPRRPARRRHRGSSAATAGLRGSTPWPIPGTRCDTRCWSDCSTTGTTSTGPHGEPSPCAGRCHVSRGRTSPTTGCARSCSTPSGSTATIRRTVPAFVAVQHYVERSFGRWRVDGGLPALADALTTRLEERKVDVRTGVRAHEVEVDVGSGRRSRHPERPGRRRPRRVVRADLARSPARPSGHSGHPGEPHADHARRVRTRPPTRPARARRSPGSRLERRLTSVDAGPPQRRGSADRAGPSRRRPPGPRRGAARPVPLGPRAARALGLGVAGLDDAVRPPRRRHGAPVRRHAVHGRCPRPSGRDDRGDRLGHGHDRRGDRAGTYARRGLRP